MTTRRFPIISKYYWIYFVISLLIIIPGVISLALFRLRPGIDFVGGTILEFSTATSSAHLQKSDIGEIIGPNPEIVGFDATGPNLYSLHLPALSDESRGSLIATLSAHVQGYKERSLSSVGPLIGQELIQKTAVAMILAAFLIAVYLAFRFQSFEYGVSAVVATLHDVVVLLGVFSLLGHFWGVQVDTLFVTALLTIASFSVHDTVVVYDRIRERKKKVLREPMSETIDASVFETLTRSLRNSLAVVIVLLSLFLLGGETTRWFAFALLIGTITGTYSSTFVALPLLIVWEKIRARGKRV
ncbi:MAG: protein translocase subunit SecF [Candidatus Woesebacteria bacterium]